MLCISGRAIVHYLFDYSPDMEYLEIVSPARFQDRRYATGHRQRCHRLTPWK